MVPALLSRPKPLSAAAPEGPVIDSAVRLSLNPVLDRRATVDGAWWPYSRDATAELPGLIAAVDQRVGRTTLRVGVYRDAWDHIPRRVPAHRRQVKVGWFRYIDPHVITLILSGAEPVVLLVVPPGTASGPAEAVLTLVTGKTTGLAPADILAAAHLPTAPGAGRADQECMLRWENEGGSVTEHQTVAAAGR
ncbi:DUF5994 family protein [Microbispora bryophytorum]|uniref:Uncharacterized protein n=1 Tax=Microbispora bryophytorum TaxID=1460882 RepID=A0A8H9H4F4_9ACTN|nr:DUF5994 family protein [Microbispora bryophytorum]MBD3139837.1 hypothetical protein [Microbispora bryophytorum]TQS02623.1 hypothetical protein FLX07_27230 [Microbispora bryophytorum]GGO27070.1 hypothetical protein GCM10011574_60090 [Microbispora bryophytorum]